MLRYAAPHSYTGEDSAELLVAGNPVLLERIIEALITSGRQLQLDVRRAEPGEYTARAFFSNRISLTQAEGVAATIAARCDAELRAAAMLRDDSIGEIATALADELAGALALVEGGIDFTDQEDVIAIPAGELRSRLQSLRDRIARHLDRAVGCVQLEAAPMVVLTGAPNAGKSTLFNALLGRRRAVVSGIAGTTRDVLIEPMHLQTNHGDAEVLLVDVAGLDEVDAGPMNRRMQTAALQARQRADLLLLCVPITQPPPSAIADNVLLVRTMSDRREVPVSIQEKVVHVSAETGAGLDELRRGIARRLADRAVSLSADAVALMPRHESALRDAEAALASALGLLKHNIVNALDEPELVAASMRTALDQLGALAGRITPDDVLGRIFASFCVGK